VLRIRYINGVEVRKNRPRGSRRGPGGSSEPPEPPICCALALATQHSVCCVRSNGEMIAVTLDKGLAVILQGHLLAFMIALKRVAQSGQGPVLCGGGRSARLG
jgi:hypothetical protein